MADEFTRHKLEWLDQVSGDLRVSGAAFRAAYILTSFFNRDNGEAWPSQETLAVRLGICKRAVRNVIASLAGAGHLQVTEACGRGKTNRYRLIIKNGNGTSPFRGPQKGNRGASFVGSEKRNACASFEASEKGNSSAPFSIEKEEQAFPLPTAKRGSAEHEKGKSDDIKRGTKLPPEHYEEHTEEVRKVDLSRSNAEVPSGSPTPEKRDRKPAPESVKKLAPNPAFETWWQQYPRRVAKDAARRAFERAVENGSATVDQLVAGAMRYGAERSDQDPQYTKHPATWLNGGCWNDEPTPRQNRTQLSRAPPAEDRPRSGVASAINGILSDNWGAYDE